MLSTVASAVITVTGGVFSVTITPLGLASSRFGPRLLRSFMNDGGHQIVLRTFIATHVYCLLVLHTVRGRDNADFVPQVAAVVSVVMVVASLGVLIHFIGALKQAYRVRGSASQRCSDYLLAHALTEDSLDGLESPFLAAFDALVHARAWDSAVLAARA